jgi:hypothetical protein
VTDLAGTAGVPVHTERMGRTALYRDLVPFSSARTEVQLDADVLVLIMPDGRLRKLVLDGCMPVAVDGCVSINPGHADNYDQRRFVRMLVLERDIERTVLITPPEYGAVAPGVVRVPQAPAESAVLEPTAWDALADWVIGGGRLAAHAIADLARLVTIATPQFAVMIGEVAAQRALELVWMGRGPLRGGVDLETALEPLTLAARYSPRAAEALVSALAHAAGAMRRRRRVL